MRRLATLSTRGRLLLGKSLRDNPRLTKDMVDRDNDVVQSNGERGNLKFVEPAARNVLQSLVQVIAQ